MIKINRYLVSFLAALVIFISPISALGDNNTPGNSNGEAIANLTPLNLEAKAESSSSLLLTWSAPIVTTDTEIRTYRVYREKEGVYQDVGVEVDATVRRWADLGLDPNTTYYYCVKTEFTDGSLSDCASTYGATLNQEGSAVDTASYPPPTDLEITNSVSSHTITINWNKPVSSKTIEGYYVYRNIGDTPKQIAGPLGDTTYTDKDLAAGTYIYQVQAAYVDGTRSALSSRITGFILNSSASDTHTSSTGASSTTSGSSGGINSSPNSFQSVGGKGGLVPCDGPEYKPGTEPSDLPADYDSCGYFDLVDLIQNIVNYMIILMTFAATLLFVYAGWLYLTSGGNPGKKSQANRIFKQVGIGIVIVLSAWIIINTIVSGLEVKDAFNPLN
jgi:hypothetical protein